MDLARLRDKRVYDRVLKTLTKGGSRPYVDIIRKIRAEEPSEQEKLFQYYLSTVPTTSLQKTVFSYMWMLAKGFNAYKEKNLTSATVIFQNALQSLLCGEARYLSPEFYNPVYIALFEPRESWSLHMDMVICCIGLMQCYVTYELDDLPKALEWLTEVEVLYGCIDLCFVNRSDTLKTIKYYEDLMNARLQMARIFMHFRNSGTAVYHTEKCRVYNTPRYIARFPTIKEINVKSRSEGCLWSRHPDICIADDWDVEFPSLQTRAIWEKLPLCSKFRPPGRRDCPTWIWHSKLYIFGGGASNKSKPGFHLIWDIWYLDLIKMDKWIRLPDVPEEYQHLGIHAKHAVVYNDFAWFFTGHRDILRFDMVLNSWGYATTEMSSRKGHKWPYTEDGLLDSSIAFLSKSMYVFGGDLKSEHKGSSVFMVLDLELLKWRYLGNLSLFTYSDHPGKYWPPPRRAAGCWIVPVEKRFYLMYGTSDLDYIKQQADPPRDPYYTDLWSYSIVVERWIRESIRGNYPCPRDDMAICYHSGLNAVILFGGRNISMKSYCDSPEGVEDLVDYMKNNELRPDTFFTYFADTFIMYMSEHRWRQFVTRSYPCDRGEARFVIDEPTGDIFLYGGCGPREFIDRQHTKKHTFRCYTDIFKLDIEQPNNFFRMDVFLTGSLNYLKYGSWRRCYTCKRIATGIRKCQGSCGGKYMYCSEMCQRTGWKEHKYIHGCRKMY